MKKSVKKKVVEVYSKIHLVKFGISGGIVCSLFVLFVSLFATTFPTWEKLVLECYGILGYNAFSFIGVLLGMIYGFIDGFIALFILAWIYNSLR